jgi:hypothetical protein
MGLGQRGIAWKGISVETISMRVTKEQERRRQKEEARQTFPYLSERVCRDMVPSPMSD